MKNHKFELTRSSFMSKTPTFLKRLGNAMVAAGTGTSVPIYLFGYEKVALVVFLVGFVGKIITSFFTTKTEE